MKYRLLDPEELHEEGDECWLASGGWRTISSLFVGCPVEGIAPCRRPLDTPLVLLIERLETAAESARRMRDDADMLQVALSARARADAFSEALEMARSLAEKGGA